MGLDIYVYKTREAKKTIAKTYENDNRKFKKQFRRRFRHYYKLLKGFEESYNNEAYISTYKKLLSYISKKTPYDWNYAELEKNILSCEELNKWLINSKYSFYIIENLYYRKVNFLYRFFSQRTVMENDAYCWASRENINELVNACESVLNCKSKGMDILPTCSGFFFGSTDYDEYYYNDVKQVMNDFKLLLDNLKDNEKVYILFSY